MNTSLPTPRLTCSWSPYQTRSLPSGFPRRDTACGFRNTENRSSAGTGCSACATCRTWCQAPPKSSACLRAAAEATRQNPAASVCPVLTPSTESSRHSSRLRLNWRILLKVIFALPVVLYDSGKSSNDRARQQARYRARCCSGPFVRPTGGIDDNAVLLMPSSLAW